ncbi:NAD(P)/FAD-dependent oxidoreductase [Rhodovulum sp. DZ06]|uniref:NAD(P)/FAD-dependent oxidoreductase n=1 Tax=Rhodovulum sp. DZ06 TaxID=3425126 RepID=UPI003D353888
MSVPAPDRGAALVIGAGPAGLAAAIRLARDGHRVVLADAAPRARRRRPGEHLPPGGLQVVEGAGLGAALADPRHGDSPGVRSAWGAAGALDRDYVFGLPGKGLNLDRAAFDAALEDQARAAGVELRWGARLCALVREGGAWRAELGGESLRAALVVDASGRRAAAARLLGARVLRRDRLTGLVGRIAGAEGAGRSGRLRIEAAPDGWWYGVRLGCGDVLAAWMCDPAAIRAHPGGALGLWGARLAASPLLAPMAAGGALPGRLEAFDASVQWTLAPGAPGFVAVGDAAAGYDPLSSWGMAKGIADGAAGAGALSRAAAGAPDALQAHHRARATDFAQHVNTRGQVYAAERRWAGAPFWAARAAAGMQTEGMG